MNQFMVSILLNISDYRKYNFSSTFMTLPGESMRINTLVQCHKLTAVFMTAKHPVIIVFITGLATFHEKDGQTRAYLCSRTVYC